MDSSNYSRGGGGAGGNDRGRGRDGDATYSATNQPPPNYPQGGAYGPAPGQSMATARRPEHGESSSARDLGAWGVRPGTALSSHHSHSSPDPEPRSHSVIPDIPSLKISEPLPPSSLPENTNGRLVPMERPDSGGSKAISNAGLLVNHFPVKFDPERTIMHYDVDIRLEVSPKGRPGKISNSDLRRIINKLFSDDPTQFPMLNNIAYDGEKNIFSAVPLPIGEFKVELSDGEGTRTRSYIISVKLVNELKLSKLEDYISGNLRMNPRDVLQVLDVVMKENPSKHMICSGGKFYTEECNEEDDLGRGVTAAKGFQQSLKPTFQGTALCLDYSVMPFHKPLPVIDFLKEHFSVNDVRWLIRLRREKIISALKGLKVELTHRVTNKNYTIAGLSDQNAQDISFDNEDPEPEGTVPPRKVGLVEHFREEYDREIKYKDIPCLHLGGNNYVPMEFCVLVAGQKFPQECFGVNEAELLEKKSLVPPAVRKKLINDMVQYVDKLANGGDVTQSFGIQVNMNMTQVPERVIGPPKLKVRACNGKVEVISVDKYEYHWNLFGKLLIHAIPVERWALIDFSSNDRHFKLNSNQFIQKIKTQCKRLGVQMKDPLVCRFTDMGEFSDVRKLRKLFNGVINEASEKSEQRLQIVVYVMTEENRGHRYIKWFSETQTGIVTQRCMSPNIINKGNNTYFENLALQINAKLGGSNVELERLPHFGGRDHVMFVGADVNHPEPWNSTCPSIAAVVATLNWPAVNRNAARICPQAPRTEKILKFGSMCLDLIGSYDRLNKVKPEKIVVFRNGVSEGQFDMVLNEELLDLKEAIKECYGEMYRPTITVVVAKKQHLTRLFPNGGSTGNVKPGTVVDTLVVHPFEFDFYLCSQYGTLGTSKPTHYHVLFDENNFTSDQLQELIYHLCFTCAHCTTPVSVVTPMYYAYRAAFRGRMYQDVVMKLNPTPAAASSSRTSLSSSMMYNAASFDEENYKLHPDLEDAMFCTS